MSDFSGQYQKLPPGWDCKYDQATGNCYYINYFTKVMQLEDPRTRYKQLQNERCSTESIPLQQFHGSGGSPYHVYPSNNPPVIRAFQHTAAANSNLNRSTSPLLSSRNQLQELSPVPFLKSTTALQTPRLGNMSRRSTIQETSFTNQIDTDAVVAKIQNMFPTAGENHIRLLLKRYYNREAVVISALQVEKHPVTMPGPFVTPPAQRHLFHSNSAFYMTPPARRLGGVGSALGYYGYMGAQSTRTISPLPTGARFGSAMSMHSGGGIGGGIGKSMEVPSYAVGAAAVPLPAIARDYHGSPRFGEQWRSSPKPHSSPKMKLRYMKTIFPKADEMLLLDILANYDNNVQKASEQLIGLGYVKRDFVAPKPNNRPPSDEQRAENEAKLIPLRPKEYNEDEKLAMQQLLKEKYPQIAEKIILMALESVNYAEDRAMQILQIVQDEDAEHAKQVDNLNAAQAMHAMHPTPAQPDDKCQLAGTDNSILTVVLETITSDNNNKLNNNNKNKNKNIINENDNEKTRSLADLNIQKSTSISTTSSSNRTTATPKQILLPSINVTTPTTATTQIILSNSPISTHNDNDTVPIDDVFDGTAPINYNNDIVKHKSDVPIARATTTINTKLTSKRNSNASILMSTSSGIALNQQTAMFITSTSSICTATSSTSSSSASASSCTFTSTSTSSASSFSTLPSSSKTFPTMTTKSILARHPNTYGIASNGVNLGHLHAHGLYATSLSSSSHSASSILEKLTATRSRDKIDSLKDGQCVGYQEDMAAKEQTDEFHSLLGRIKAMGHNATLAQGPDENLLLADYVTWNGANPDISVGHKQTHVHGADATILTTRSYVPNGRNPDLCKGPQKALAKGSIYAQMAAAVGASNNAANIKCN